MQKSEPSNFNLKISYGDGKDLVGDVLAKRRKRLADSRIGIIDQFPPAPREQDKTKITGIT